MESTIYIFIVVYLLGDIASIYLPKISKNCIANEMYQNFRPFIYLSIIQTIHLFSFILFFFFFLFRTPAVKTYRVKIMQLVSPVSQSRDIDARAPLDSKENIAKKVNYRMCW